MIARGLLVKASTVYNNSTNKYKNTNLNEKTSLQNKGDYLIDNEFRAGIKNGVEVEGDIKRF